MKTKLLLFLLSVTTLVNAQVNFFEDFDSASPDLTGWVYTGFLVNNTEPCSGTKSLVKDFVATGSTGRVTTRNYVSNGNQIIFKHKYKMKKTATGNNPQANHRVDISVNDGPLINVYNANGGFSQFCGNQAQVVIPASAVPAGSNVKISVEYTQYDNNYKLTLDDFWATQALNYAAPSITNVSAVPTALSSKIVYTLNANNANTTSIIKYGLTSSALTSQITGFTATSDADVSGDVTISGLLANTQYFYRVEATNSEGSTVGTIQDFTTSNPVSTEYNFNATYNNTAGSNPFNSGTFVDDRNSVAASAMSTTGSSATIPSNLLPSGSSDRTISIWYKTSTNANYPEIFSYGKNVNSQTFGLYLSSKGSPVFYAHANDHDFGGIYPASTWRHAAITYDGVLVKMYINGALVGSKAYTLNTVLATNSFRFGQLSSSTHAYDDLKIYNYVLTDAEIANLYSNNTTLATAENVGKDAIASIYPNPVREVLNIKSSINIKEVQVFNSLGQKVLQGKGMQINTSKLKSGVYLIRITNSKNEVTTSKFIKN